ncbi:trypsin-like peptidase domain-containing protein, partial [Kocuria sp. NPDC057446]|uniref:trypsin-like peptidase domain-containing protein n=1 Tax=Kocuria sp. NPDC057446 TaxID=3346137 RepID=UPI0036CE2B79
MRIELRAVAEIAHVDHTTGEVEIDRGRSTVPLGAATGVMTSADGIVATTWENLDVDEDAVAVYAGNELFATEMRVPILGNDGDPARRGYTTDSYWAPHLQHCYDQVTHCILFHVPQYHVRTYTAESGGVNAELLNAPSDPGDVALLRISGGGGAPTAQLAESEAVPDAETALFGFTERPTTEAGPAEIPSSVDMVAGRIESPDELAPPLDAGVSGGPVVDRTTGQIIGLAGPLEQDGSATFVPAADIQAAMEEEGVEASSSKFDAVFRRGIDHLSAGNLDGSVSALEEALTYYESAHARGHLDQARAMADEQAINNPEGGTADRGPQGSLRAAFLPVLAGILLLAGIVVTIVMRRRGRSGPGPTGGNSAAATGNPPPRSGPR